LLGYLKCFVRSAQDIFKEDYAYLPNQGNIYGGKTQGFIKLKKIKVPSESEHSSLISTKKDEHENNDPTLEYEMVLLPLDYYGNSRDTFHLLNVFESFGVEDNLFYNDLTVGYLIDFLWQKFELYLWALVFFFTINAVLFTLFAIYYQEKKVS